MVLLETLSPIVNQHHVIHIHSSNDSLNNFLINLVPKPVEFDDPCNPSPCGANAHCSNGICTCVSLYQGDPYVGCRPECVINSECLPSKACINQKCVDPCSLETCGRNAICQVFSHVPMCSCPESMTGNALVSCRPMDRMLFSNSFFRLNIDHIIHYQPSSFSVLVIRHLAVLTVSVGKLMDKVFVHAFKAISEVHHHVGQNVLLTPSVLWTKRVLIRNVLILVPALVDKVVSH